MFSSTQMTNSTFSLLLQETGFQQNTFSQFLWIIHLSKIWMHKWCEKVVFEVKSMKKSFRELFLLKEKFKKEQNEMCFTLFRFLRKPQLVWSFITSLTSHSMEVELQFAYFSVKMKILTNWKNSMNFQWLESFWQMLWIFTAFHFYICITRQFLHFMNTHIADLNVKIKKIWNDFRAKSTLIWKCIKNYLSYFVAF